MQILQIGEKNSKNNFNIRAKAGTGREAVIVQISAKKSLLCTGIKEPHPAKLPICEREPKMFSDPRKDLEINVGAHGLRGQGSMPCCKSEVVVGLSSTVSEILKGQGLYGRESLDKDPERPLHEAGKGKPGLL